MTLFTLSFPGILHPDGVAFSAFLFIIPVYYAISLMNYGESVFYGFGYGTGSYLLFNYWLKEFDPVSFSVLPTIMGLYHILLFILVLFIYRNIKKHQYIYLSISWICYEVFKGENIIGYTYGTIAQSMYRTHLFTGVIDITGTYLLSLLIVFPGVLLVTFYVNRENISVKERKISSLTYLIIMFISILYTQLNKVDYTDSRTLKTALIQHNLDSWAMGNNNLYKETLDNLLELTEEALNHSEKIDLVVWSETAFVPAIEWHKTHKKSFFRLNLVKTMELFFKNSNPDYIIGANETIGLKDADKVYYNSSYLYQNGEITDKYRKINLVPFTERYPFPGFLPELEEYIKGIGGKSITPGDEQKNFITNGIEVTPLICYEDTFSNITREGVLKGSSLIVNMTNDAWSNEEACSKQHLAASVFRSIENRRSFIRVGTGGYTAVIDPNGKILQSLPILTKAQFTYDVPIYNEKRTFYTKFGPLLEYIILTLFTIKIVYSFIMSTLPFLRLKKRQDLN